jgi:hypothetical protein
MAACRRSITSSPGAGHHAFKNAFAQLPMSCTGRPQDRPQYESVAAAESVSLVLLRTRRNPSAARHDFTYVLSGGDSGLLDGRSCEKLVCREFDYLVKHFVWSLIEEVTGVRYWY